MDLQGYLDAQCRIEREKAVPASGQCTLGKLLYLLEHIEDKTQPIHFDFCRANPRGLNSYRGIYAELAISYDFDYKKEVSVADLIDLLRGAIGGVYLGWKGGEYIMSANTPLWVDNQGECSETAIMGIIEDDYGVFIKTTHLDPYPIQKVGNKQNGLYA